MSLVIDSSVAIAWLMTDEHSTLADRAIAHAFAIGADLPPLFFVEVANALVTNARRGRIRREDITPRLTDLRRIDVRFDHLGYGERLGAVTAAAATFKLSVYDATYFELAQRLDLPLATLDDPLTKAAKAAGVALFTP